MYVEVVGDTFLDAGSIPAASTNSPSGELVEQLRLEHLKLEKTLPLTSTGTTLKLNMTSTAV